MINLVEELTLLGFNLAGAFPDAFIVDDNDGGGPYIKQWNSKLPCPFPEYIRVSQFPTGNT